MKKQYVAPEIEIIKFDVTDIITHSLATGNGDNNSGGKYPFGSKSSTTYYGYDGNTIYTDYGTFGGN